MARYGATGQHSGVPRNARQPAKHPALKRLGTRIRHLREGQKPEGMSQEELANRAEVGRSYISGVERGVRNCSVLFLHKVATVLKVRPRDLLD